MVRIFLYSDWIRRFTIQENTDQKLLCSGTLFTQWYVLLLEGIDSNDYTSEDVSIIFPADLANFFWQHLISPLTCSHETFSTFLKPSQLHLVWFDPIIMLFECTNHVMYFINFISFAYWSIVTVLSFSALCSSTIEANYFQIFTV